MNFLIHICLVRYFHRCFFGIYLVRHFYESKKSGIRRMLHNFVNAFVVLSDSIDDLT